MHAISSYRSNRPTNKQTDRNDYNTLRRSFASAQRKNITTLKSQSTASEGHWKWYHSTDWVYFPISVPQWLSP